MAGVEVTYYSMKSRLAYLNVFSDIWFTSAKYFRRKTVICLAHISQGANQCPSDWKRAFWDESQWERSSEHQKVGDSENKLPFRCRHGSSARCQHYGRCLSHARRKHLLNERAVLDFQREVVHSRDMAVVWGLDLLQGLLNTDVTKSPISPVASLVE